MQKSQGMIEYLKGIKRPERIPIYKCYNRTQHKTVCDGPCSYRAYKVDIICEMLLTPERLTRRMDAVETELEQIKDFISITESQIQQSSELLSKIRQEHRQLLSWADMFADVDIEVQKMVTSYIIKRVTVGVNYELDVERNIDEGQFVMGMG